MKYGILYTDNTKQVIFTKTKLDLTKSIATITQLHRDKPENSFAIVDDKGETIAKYYSLDEFTSISEHTMPELIALGYSLVKLNKG